VKTLAFEHITFSYKKGKILFKDLSFKIEQPTGKGFVVGLMGASGSGKSTILKLILGIETNYLGKISISPDNPVISYVPQEPVLFEHLTPKENAEYFKRVGNYKSKFSSELFNEAAKALQIEDVLQNATSVNEISGGQRQRISLLRAMSIQPDILLLDEPLTGLDEEVKDQFLQTLATLIQRLNLMVLYVTHHRKEAEFISDTILYLEKENKSETVTSASQTTAKLFFDNPPTISALNATKDIQVNTLNFIPSEDGKVELPKSITKNEDIQLMSFGEDVIHFSENFGFEVEKIAETGTYTLLQLKDTQTILTVDNETYKKNSSSKYISLIGNINLYNNKGQFLKTATINNNQISK